MGLLSWQNFKKKFNAEVLVLSVSRLQLKSLFGFRDTSPPLQSTDHSYTLALHRFKCLIIIVTGSQAQEVYSRYNKIDYQLFFYIQFCLDKSLGDLSQQVIIKVSSN